jgi:type II secretion system protein H
MRISKVGKLNNKTGFTLIELIVVLFILAMLLGVVTPKVISGLYGNTQSSIIRKLNGSVAYARNQAMLEGQLWVMRLDLENSRMCLFSKKELEAKEDNFGEKDWKSLAPLAILDIQDEAGNIKDNDTFDVYFNPKGLAQPTIIHLADTDNDPFKTVQLKPFNKQIELYPGYVDYDDIFGQQE